MKRILLADDDVDDKVIIKDAVEQVSNGNDIIYFSDNGEEVLRILNRNFENKDLPCLIVLDLNMPKMNGTETLRVIKNDDRFKNIPVIIYSTSINPMEREKCIHLGAHSYITKPITYKESIDIARLFFEFCEKQPVQYLQ